MLLGRSYVVLFSLTSFLRKRGHRKFPAQVRDADFRLLWFPWPALSRE